MTISRILSALCALFMMTGVMGASAMAHSHEKSLDDVIAGDHRSDAHKARDKYRHPKETLEFFGVTAAMSVVEIWPGAGGWYQEILAPFLNEKGQYYNAGFDLSATEGFLLKANQAVAARLASDKALYGNVVTTEFAPPAKGDMVPEGSVDMVLSFRNFHNWQMNGNDKAALQAIYKALKPGGIFGLTDHRSEESSGKDGYIKPSYLKAAAKEAGFILMATSEVNANAKDTHAHERGVWTLPPRLAGKTENHDEMRAIGESDRLTYKFQKPVK